MTTDKRRVRVPIDPLTLVCLIWIGVTFLCVGVGMVAPMLGQTKFITYTFFVRQDIPVAALMLLAIPILLLVAKVPLGRGEKPDFPRSVILAMASCAGVFCWFGGGLVFDRLPLSMDEYWAVTDAQMFARWSVMAPVPEELRPYLDALQPIFIRDIEGNTHLGSSYYPGNALLHAVLGASYAAPVLAAVALVATYGVSLQIFPQRRDIAAAAVILLLTSAQFLVLAMTPYAMTAHLAVNMVWLWLVLKDRISSDLAAIILTFLGVSLHQLVFFPLFAAPIIVTLFVLGRRRAAVLHGIALLVSIGFWVQYDGILLSALGTAPTKETGAGAGRLMDLFFMLLGRTTLADVSIMAQNLTRFLSWQNLLVLPMCLLAIKPAWYHSTLIRTAVLAVIGTFMFMALVIPFQGHGWGYRYIHGLLGLMCILAAFWWARAVVALPAAKAKHAWRGFYVVAVFAAVVQIPIQMNQAHMWVEPYSKSYAAIAASDRDLVIVDAPTFAYAADLVRNDPFLQTGPFVMMRTHLSDEQVTALCGQFAVAVFSQHSANAFGIMGELQELSNGAQTVFTLCPQATEIHGPEG